MRPGTKILGLIAARADATAAGLAIGRQRRSPTHAERARWCMGSPGVRDAFFTGLHRGRGQAAALQQIAIAGVA